MQWYCENPYVQAFFSIASEGNIPVAVGGDKIVSACVSNSQGTFLATSDNPRNRAFAAIMACHDAREVVCPDN